MQHCSSGSIQDLLAALLVNFAVQLPCSNGRDRRITLLQCESIPLMGRSSHALASVTNCKGPP